MLNAEIDSRLWSQGLAIVMVLVALDLASTTRGFLRTRRSSGATAALFIRLIVMSGYYDFVGRALPDNALFLPKPWPVTKLQEVIYDQLSQLATTEPGDVFNRLVSIA
ncbi:hypothetical protein [Pseudomonas putida]|uniref:hypothetical protein n=1 Tax=Pseudomonas putida TaxID=303 RepID=UPI000CBDADA3|nr:hypothetical protein [Pseudomonas putida]PNG87239.1 hypothetical protein CBL13_01097 [Pseudomonas putida]